jgi:hypothetical protein
VRTPPPTDVPALLLRLQKSAGNAAVAGVLQRMKPEGATAEDDASGWYDEQDLKRDEEVEQQEPDIVDLFEDVVATYRSINEGEEYDPATDKRVQGLIKFWDGPFGAALKPLAATVADSKGNTVDMIVKRVKENDYKCHHNATIGLEEIIKRLREDRR